MSGRRPLASWPTDTTRTRAVGGGHARCRALRQAGGFDTGWTAYPPLSERGPLGQQFFILTLLTVGVASILGGLNFLTTVIGMRAPGMTLSRVPIFVWSIVATSRLDFHPRRNAWVGYVVQLGGRTYYRAGDTDHLSELERVRTDVAFVPIGGTYTMDVGESARLAKAMRPTLAVPMHHGFVPGVGTAADGERFRSAARPVEVTVLQPVAPFANR